MDIKRTALISLIASTLLLAGCSNDDNGADAERLAGSKATYVSLENQLADWWGGDGIPITWSVSEVVDADWDGTSRPDAAPPKGLQGLVLDAFSDARVTRLELNYSPTPVTKTRRFVLTPAVTVDGQQIDLPSITFFNRDYMAYSWEMIQGGVTCTPNTPAPTVKESWSAKTPRGVLQYDVLLTCPDGINGAPAKVLIRNYQKS